MDSLPILLPRVSDHERLCSHTTPHFATRTDYLVVEPIGRSEPSEHVFGRVVFCGLWALRRYSQICRTND